MSRLNSKSADSVVRQVFDLRGRAPPILLPTASKKKLSYMESREYSTIEQRIAEAEELLAQKKAAAEDPAIATDAARLLSAHAELEAAQKKVDELFTRWSELEAKLS